MWQLIKRDFSFLILLFIFAFAFRFIIGFFSIFESTNTYFYSFIFMIVYAFLFMQDRQANIMQTIISLPIKKSHIIISRYISLYSASLIFLGINFFVDTVIEQHAFHLINVYLLLIAVTIAIAVTTPIYYYFKSTWASVIVQYALILIGVFATVFVFADPFDWFAPFIIGLFNFIELQPLLVIGGFLIILMIVSIRVSTYLFKTRDFI